MGCHIAVEGAVEGTDRDVRGTVPLTDAPLRDALHEARARRNALVGMSFARRLVGNPRQAVASLLNTALSMLPSATVTVSAKTFWGEGMSVVLPEVVSSEQDLAPDFVKIDAESAEFEVLEGMERLLRHTRPVVSLEVGDLGVEGAPPSADLVRHLTERGYRSLEYVDGAFREHCLRDRYAYGNLLFVPA